ncbi:MAG: metallophosphoesterase [Tepidisphaeraceae bacterium]
MRLIVTADLHFNHKRSRPLAIDLIERINQRSGDVLLLIGDTAAADGDDLEQALSSIRFPGPKLFVAGNHELWTNGPDSHHLFQESLPARVRALGWQWLETEPFVAGDVALVGSIGWYDYSFAPRSLGIPDRFYEAKISPGAAERLNGYAHLLGDDVPDAATDIFARWNDGRHIKLGRSDHEFLQERMSQLKENLASLTARRIVAAVHHVPFEELLPPRHSPTWDFARAYLGTAQMGQLLAADPRVTHVLCGHSHFPIDQSIGTLRAINVGSGYREKRLLELDL